MKRYFLFTIMSVLLISCQQSLTPDQSDLAVPKNEVMTRALSTGKVGPDDPVVFLPAVDLKAWTNIGPLEDRFAACEVPASRLRNMTTEALVKSMMSYPLNFMVCAYDDPKDAIDLIIQYSPLHQEFLSRSDAAEVFVDFYAGANLDMSLEKSDFDGNYTSLSYANAMFMDHFIASGLMTGLGKASVRQKLTEAVSKKLQERLQDSETFSVYSIRPLVNINVAESLGINVVADDTSARSGNTLLLPRNTVIYYTENIEASSAELNALTQMYTSNYPNAIVRGPSTMKYNSHSYAWYRSSTDNDKIIPSFYNGNFQLDEFWKSGGLFSSCGDNTSAKIVYYSDGDHSAAKVSYNTYVSKWGYGPLMEHAPSYCPYIVTNMQYYLPRMNSGTRPISGNTPVALNQANDYTISGFGEGFDYRCTVLFMDAPSPTPFELQQVSSNKYRLVCQDYGYFNMKYEGYYNDYCFERNTYAIICMP